MATIFEETTIRDITIRNRLIRSPTRCVSCNRCFQPGVEESGIYCVAEKKKIF